ncbi:MAG: GntR family transcriptional regulator [Gemmiger sp.]
MSTRIRAIRPPEESAREFAYRIVAMYINEMLFLPGEKLVESDIAAQLGVSRTPVHDTFVQLVREKQLVSEPRGTYVSLLQESGIRQQKWMHQTMGLAVLAVLYNERPAFQELEALERCVAEEQALLEDGRLGAAASCHWKFRAGLYHIAGYGQVYRALYAAGTDFYRLFKMADDPALWRRVVEGDSQLVQALALHSHEKACEAFNGQYALVEPLLAACRRQKPHYFA